MNFNKLALNNVLRDKWTYFAYFLSSVFSVFIFFSFAVAMFHPDLRLIKNGSALSMAMTAGNIIIYLFSFLFISYSVRAFMKSREKTLAVFITLGASNKQLNKMIFKENMFIGMSAIFTAIFLGLIFSPFSLMITKKIMLVEGFSMYVPVKAIALTLGLFFVLFAIIAFISPRFIQKEKVILLLKADKTPEKEVSFYPILFAITIMLCMGQIFTITSYNKVQWARKFLDSSLGVFILLGMILVSLYFLYMQVGILIIRVMTKKKMYMKKTNMLILSDMKTKFRTNAKVMYLMTILFTGAFYAIVFLYAQNVDVEKNTKASYPYSYMYASLSNNDKEQKHSALIEDILKHQKGYKSYLYTVRCEGTEFRDGIISETEYNEALKGVGEQPISLRENEVYCVSVSPKITPKPSITNITKKVFKRLKLTPQVKGVGTRNITPEGYFTTLTVIDDKLAAKLSQDQGYNTLKFYVYSIDEWKTYSHPKLDFAEEMHNEPTYKFALFSQNDLYMSEKNGKNLSLYIGFSISIIFVIAAISIMYFRLITDIEKECAKFRGIVRIGLSQKELSKIISVQNFTLMFIPFTVAIALLFAGIGPLNSLREGSYTLVAIICFGIFLGIQTIGYKLINSKYKKGLFKQLL